MAQQRPFLGGVEEGDLIGPKVLKDIVEYHIQTDSGTYTLSGSLQDHRVDDYAKLLRFKRTGAEIEYKLRLDWGSQLEEGKGRKERNRLKNSFLRAGVIEHSNISHVIERLRQYDDIIVGLDTNILWDCILSSQLLEKIYEQSFPNWILVAIPKLVMAETENAANNKIEHGEHARTGWPTYKGRLAQRGLQELMNLRTKNPDRPGLAIMTVGELDLDVDDVNKSNWKLDSEIRTQFQKFLSQISFHKGTFFLSQDRVNVMMSGTEGADGLYLQKPDINEFSSNTFGDEEFTTMIYELAVQFGGICLKSIRKDGFRMCLDVFWPGKQVSDWRHSKLKVTELHHSSPETVSPAYD